MRKKLMFVVICFSGIFINTEAQYVDIADTTFRNDLMTKFPTCFNAAKQLDTTCSPILSTQYYDLSFTTAGSIDGIQYFKNLDTLRCIQNKLTILPPLPVTLKMLFCSWNQLTVLPSLPPGLVNLYATYNQLGGLPALPATLKNIGLQNNALTSLPALPGGLLFLDCSESQLTSMPALPDSLTYLDISQNPITVVPVLSDSIKTFYCQWTQMPNLPVLPPMLVSMDCRYNHFTSLPALPASMTLLFCDSNRLTNLPPLPAGITQIFCNKNRLTSLPPLPPGLTMFDFSYNQLVVLPALPLNLTYINGNSNQLNALPALPPSLSNLQMSNNPDLHCLPFLPSSLQYLNYENTGIACLPNAPGGCSYSHTPVICNALNNVYQCESFPQVNGIVFNDNNANGVKDAGDFARPNIRVQLSNGMYSYTNNNGAFALATDTLGSYAITVTSPAYYDATPVSYIHNFTTYSDNFTDTFALRANTLKDSLAIHITPLVNRARPGFAYGYYVVYENDGTTILSPKVVLKYNSLKLSYDSSSATGAIQNGDSLVLNATALHQGESRSFMAYFTVSPTGTHIGDTLTVTSSIKSALAQAFDSASVNVSGSYDPNDKEATPEMTPAQVVTGNYIDYIIRFQNTGNDTAFNVVISDTLDNLLQKNVLQIIGSSHLCRTTLNNGVIYFEFLNINLPDSNVSKVKSNGFVRFRIKPDSTVALGDVIPNKASIYFDYNAPIVTNTCQTIIASRSFPLSLLHYKATLKEKNKILNEWATANEINTWHFNVQRSSNGKDFITIAVVNASGKNNSTQSYSYTDEYSSKGSKLYYRLEIMDNDGRKTYSPVQLIVTGEAGISFYPNPAHGVVTVEAAGIKLLSISDNTGRLMLTRNGQYQDIIKVNISSLARGIYLLKAVTISGDIKTQKLIVE